MTPAPKLALSLAGGLLALNIADVLTTEMALRRGAHEVNPIMRASMRHLGRPATYGIKMGAVTFAAMRLNPVGLILGTALMVGVVTNNLLWMGLGRAIMAEWHNSQPVTPSASAGLSIASTPLRSPSPRAPSGSPASPSAPTSSSTPAPAATPPSPLPATR